jgi:hypothetical protein
MPEPVSSVTFFVKERAGRFALWINENFNVDNSLQGEKREEGRGGTVYALYDAVCALLSEYDADYLLLSPSLPLSPLKASQNRLAVELVSLRDGSPLRLVMTPDNGGRVTVQTDDMELAAEIIQDLSAFWQVCFYMGYVEVEHTCCLEHNTMSTAHTLITPHTLTQWISPPCPPVPPLPPLSPLSPDGSCVNWSRPRSSPGPWRPSAAYVTLIGYFNGVIREV